jgi:hypothetical protein
MEIRKDTCKSCFSDVNDGTDLATCCAYLRQHLYCSCTFCEIHGHAFTGYKFQYIVLKCNQDIDGKQCTLYKRLVFDHTLMRKGSVAAHVELYDLKYFSCGVVHQGISRRVLRGTTYDPGH